MKLSNKRGFTLIEVLVVVLIISVLVTWAVPQYQKAVLKSRYSAMIPIAKKLADGNEAYYMEHGKYAQTPTELPIQGKAEYTDGTHVNMIDGKDLSYVEVTNTTNIPNARYVVYQKHSNTLADATVCEAADERAQALCQHLGGKVTTPATQSGWTAYLLTGINNREPVQCQVGAATLDEGQTLGSSGVKCGVVCQNGTCENTLTNRTVYDTNYSGQTIACDGTSAYSCAGSEFLGRDNVCEGRKQNSCAYSTFSGAGSLCHGNVADSCVNSLFSGWGSHCVGNGTSACASTFSGRQSACYGDRANGCTGATIQAGASCIVRRPSGCDGVKYGTDPTGLNQGLGSCLPSDLGSATHGDCPTGVPLRGNWNASKGAYDIQEWKDGYCDATAMVTGVCPAGSPTGSVDTPADKTTAAGWYGGYCDPLISGKCPAGSPTANGKCWNGNGSEIDC